MKERPPLYSSLPGIQWVTRLIIKPAVNKTPLKALAGYGVWRVGRGGSHGCGGSSGLEAVAELCIPGLSSLRMRVRVSSQKSPALPPRGRRLGAAVAVFRQAGLLYHWAWACLLPADWEPQPTCSEWEAWVGDWRLRIHHSGSCIALITDRELSVYTAVSLNVPQVVKNPPANAET